MNSLLVLKHLFVIDENSSTYFPLKSRGRTYGQPKQYKVWGKYQVKIWLCYSLSNVEVDKTHS